MAVEKSDLEKEIDALKATNAKLRAEVAERERMERYWAERAPRRVPATPEYRVVRRR